MTAEETDLTLGEVGRSVARIERMVTDLTGNLEKYVRTDDWQRSELAAGKRVGEVDQRVADLDKKLEKHISDSKAEFEKYKAEQRAEVRSRMSGLVYPVASGAVLAAILSVLQLAN